MSKRTYRVDIEVEGMTLSSVSVDEHYDDVEMSYETVAELFPMLQVQLIEEPGDVIRRDSAYEREQEDANQ